MNIAEKAKDLYDSKKNGDGYKLTNDCSVSMKLHKKSSPESAVWKTDTSAKMSFDAVDLAIAAAAVGVIGIALGIIGVIKHICK